nr:hypothetical protein CFP56_57047 [Quercus suber]
MSIRGVFTHAVEPLMTLCCELWHTICRHKHLFERPFSSQSALLPESKVPLKVYRLRSSISMMCLRHRVPCVMPSTIRENVLPELNGIAWLTLRTQISDRNERQTSIIWKGSLNITIPSSQSCSLQAATLKQPSDTYFVVAALGCGGSS